MNVLIVDDDLADVRILTRALSEHSAINDVADVPDFEQALKALRENKYDLVFVDQHLGPRKGTDLIKNIPTLNIDAQFVILTGLPIDLFKSGIYVNQRAELGEVPVVRKPLDLDALSALLKIGSAA